MIKKNIKVTVLFWLNRSRGNENSVPLWCRVSISSQRYNFSMNYKVTPKEWDSEAQCVVKKAKDYRHVAELIEQTRTEIRIWANRLLDEGIDPTCELFKNERSLQQEDYHSLLSLFEYHKAVEKQTLTESTMKLYDNTERHVRKFLLIKYHVSDIDIKRVKKDFAPEFVAYLKGWKRDPKEPVCHQNGAMKNLQRINRLMNIAVDNDWIQTNPVGRYKKVTQKVERDFLTEEEMKAITGLENLKITQSIVRDCFLVACDTGMSYIDCKKLTYKQISVGIDGQLWLNYTRQKTGQSARVPLLDPTRDILQKYEKFHDYNPKRTMLPIPTNQDCNRELKKIAAMAGIEKNVTFHMGRHTFATTITLMNDIPIETVSSMLGHAKISTTQIYAKVVGKKVMKDTAPLRAIYNDDKDKGTQKEII